MAQRNSKHLVIVESPAKARTIGKYLGKGYEVAASVGHVRDLPPKELGVDVEGGFEPHYVTIRGKAKIITELRRKAKSADRVILATDPDREGEAIAYHVAGQLGWPEGDGERFQRVQFHEITRGAIREALERPGRIDMKKVEAQQARRILDRLVGYQVSPFLWKPIRPGLSAGRVQTVALRLICEREEEIRRFETLEYWSLTAHLRRQETDFDAALHKIEGRTFTLGNEAETTAVLDDIVGVAFEVSDVKRRERRKNPAPPFTTSTLQQEAAKRLRFSARKTMTLAQRLYEGVDVGGRGLVGLITYMRTDSTRVAGSAVEQARAWVEGEMGKEYNAPTPRSWAGKQQKGAQEAHEAIRPTDVTLHPSEAASYLDGDLARLYEIIWLRFVAGQMAPALYDTTTVDFDLEGATGRRYLFRATGSVVKFRGFTRLYLEATEAGDHRRLDDLEPLPDMSEGDVADLKAIEPRQHFTQPPPRFSEASLVKALEELGIGRPSTYAAIISVILDRGYVDMEQRRFKPTELGDVVARLLIRVFPTLFDVDFTSRMEGELDRVEEGEVEWRAVLEDFYPQLRERLEAGEGSSDEIVKEILAAEGETCELCGRPMQVKFNKGGSFLGCSGYPECRNTRSTEPPMEKELGRHPDTGQPVYLKSGMYGPYVQLGEADNGGKPPRSSLPEGREPGDVTLAYALKLLSLPRVVGPDPESGEEITAGLGRYGPYVRRGKTFASLRTEEQLFEIGPVEARELIERKEKGGRTVIKELGAHPDSGRDVHILEGRYGPYVTDGEVNATIPKKSDPLDVTMDDALDLLERKRARKGGGRAASPKKTSRKRTPGKKAARKKTAGKKASPKSSPRKKE